MAELRKVVIEVISGGQDNGRGGGNVTYITKNTNITNITNNKNVAQNIVEQVNPLGAVLANQAYEQAKALAKNAVGFYINRQLTLKEDYMNERNLQNALTTINKGVGFATAIAGGFALGGLAGAIISSIGFIGNEGINQFKRYDTAYRELTTNNINLAFARTRAGLNGETGTEN